MPRVRVDHGLRETAKHRREAAERSKKKTLRVHIRVFL
jgi:hypothetical protein